ncbi:MAG: hypothetical protein GXX96_18200 [Planctomycetaceae bacterium]|jgi:hypothetical protein|nr:hypothetical protein [Planctomycetaceae bacterium]
MAEQKQGGELRLGRLFLGLMALFFLIMNVVMFAGVRLGGLSAGVALGTIAAEVTLCAVFAALAPFSVFVRVITGVAGAAVVCLAVFRVGGASNEDRVIISAAAFLQWIAVQVPLWVFRIHSGWCLRLSADRTSEFSRRDLQFGIRQMMAWTAVVAVFLSLAKTLIPSGFFERSPRAEMITIVAILVVFSSLAAWPMIWAAFVRSRMFIWCVVAVACSAILCMAEVWAFETAVKPGVNVATIVAMHLVQLVAVGGSLLVVRLNGIRLVRAGDVVSAA